MHKNSPNSESYQLELFQFLDAIHDAAFVTAENGLILFCNKAFRKMFRFDAKGTTYIKTIGAVATETGYSVGKTAQFGGREVSVIHVSPPPDRDIILNLVMAESDDLEHTAHQALMHNISFEVRTVLTMMSASLNLLKNYLPGDEKSDEYYKMLNQNIARLTRFANNISDAVNPALSDGALYVNDIAHFCRELLSGVVPYLNRKQISYEILVPDRPVYMQFCAEKIERLLLHLIANSIQNTREQNKIIFSLTERENSVLLKVTDFGMGIPHTILPYIFGKYELPLSIDTLTENPGLGLGLSVVQNIARAHGGTIMIESVESEGTTVSVSLPKGEDDIIFREANASHLPVQKSILVELSAVLGYEEY